MSDSFEAIDPDLNYFTDSFDSPCSLVSVEEYVSISRSKNFMNILNYNIRSFYQNSNFFLPIVELAMPHVLVLTETWFTDDYHPSIINFDSYHSIRSSRSGGVQYLLLIALTLEKLTILVMSMKILKFVQSKYACPMKNYLF